MTRLEHEAARDKLARLSPEDGVGSALETARAAYRVGLMSSNEWHTIRRLAWATVRSKRPRAKKLG